MFRREWNRYCDNWGVSGFVQDMQIESDDIASWDIDTSGPNWSVSTRYDFLRLEGFIQKNLAQPRILQLARAFHWMLDDVLSGALWRTFRASWRMGVLLIYSQIALLLWVGLALASGWYAARTIGEFGLSAILTFVMAAVTSFATFLLLRPIVDAMFVNQLNNCWPYLREFARGKPTDFDRLVDVFAHRIIAASNAGDVDEILVVGHSAGAMLALTAAQRALEIDPSIGANRPQLSLITVGSIMPALALHPAAGKLRNTIRMIAVERALLWTDCQSREDFMNFWAFDPVAGVGIDVGPERCNPHVWPVPIQQMISPDIFKKVRFNYWRMHYQYIMSNDRRASYDYFMFVCGPAPFALWAARDQNIRDAFDKDATYRVPNLKAAE